MSHALIIDDSMVVSRSIQDRLLAFGFHSFDHTWSETQALEAVAKRRPDLIVIGDHGANRSPFDIAREVAAVSQAPILAVSTNGSGLKRSVPFAATVQRPFPLPQASAPSRLAPRRGGLPPRALRKVREFVGANLEKIIRINDLALVVGLSPFHFARAFKHSEGVTPHEYVIQCRVRRVMEMLVRTELSLAEVALACGFADQSHCARRFREYVGVTPGTFRWQMT